MTDARRPLALLAASLILVACSTAPAATATPVDSRTATPTSTASPSPTATVTATPTPTATATAAATATATSGTPGGFAVAPNAEADALFLVRDDCENSRDGYRLEFPEDWWTNTEFGDFPPCVWFSPTYYEVRDEKAVPDEIAIVFEYHTGDVGTLEEVLSQESVTVGGQPAYRVEVRGAAGEGGTMPRDWYQYSYLVQLGPTEEEGPNLVARTTTDMGGDYELNKAVLDRIMATLELIGSIQ